WRGRLHAPGPGWPRSAAQPAAAAAAARSPRPCAGPAVGGAGDISRTAPGRTGYCLCPSAVPGGAAARLEPLTVPGPSAASHKWPECSFRQELCTMERLLRTLFTVRGLILAATLTLAALGGYLDRGTTLPIAKVSSQLALQVHAMDRSQ